MKDGFVISALLYYYNDFKLLYADRLLNTRSMPLILPKINKIIITKNAYLW